MNTQNEIFRSEGFILRSTKDAIYVEKKRYPIIIGLIISLVAILFLAYESNHLHYIVGFLIYLLISVYLLISFKRNYRCITKSDIVIDKTKSALKSGILKTKRLGYPTSYSYLLWYIKDDVTYSIFNFKKYSSFEKALSIVQEVIGNEVEIEIEEF